MKISTGAEFNVQQDKNILFDRVGRNVSKWSDESYSCVEFISGIKLDLFAKTIYHDYSLKNRHEDLQMLISKFYLSGHHRVVSPGIANVEAEYSEQAGQNYLFYLPNIEEIEQFFSGSPLQMVRIYTDLKYLRSFITDLNEVPQQLQPLIERNDAPTFHRRVGKVTPVMLKIIKQMWQHPYQGTLSRMYLKAKTLELLAMQLAQLAKSDFYIARVALTTNKIDPIYEARNILSDRLVDPPSIPELAELVGVSILTLRNGFRQIFGTTVIGYLKQQRMQQAEMMLKQVCIL